MTSTSYRARQKEILDDLFRGSTSQREAAKQLDELFLEVWAASHPDGKLNSLYHDLYSGKGKEWTAGFRTGYDMSTTFCQTSIRKVISGDDELNSLEGELDG